MRINYVAKRYPLFELACLQLGKKIFLDKSFQSRARWGNKQKQKFLRSCIEGFNLSAITIAHIKALYGDIVLNEGEDSEDALWLKDLMDQGYEYITVDGNNRDETLAQFFTDKIIPDYSIPLAEGKYDLGDRVLNVTADKKYFCQFSKIDQQFLKNLPIWIHFITEGGRKALRKAFRVINDGMKLNDQELRNALSSKFADLVRDLVDEEMEAFKKIYTILKINRRFPDEFIVDVAVLNAQGIVMINPEARDAAYGDNTKEKTSFNKTKKIINQIAEIVNKHGKSGLNVEKKMKSNLYDLVLLLRYLNDNNVRIDDLDKFYNFFVETQSKRIRSTETVWNNKKGTDPRAYAGIMKNLQPNFLSKREEIIMGSLGEIEEGVLTYLDKKRNYDARIRFILWERQGKKCSITGKDISPVEVCNGDITHVDHHVPHTLGGPTTLENARLVFKSENQSKGAKLNSEIELVDDVDDDLVA